MDPFYHIVGKFGKFSKPSAIRQTKTIQISSYRINNPLASLFIRQTSFCQTLEKSKFTKHSPCQTFLLYSIFAVAEVKCCKLDEVFNSITLYFVGMLYIMLRVAIYVYLYTFLSTDVIL